MNHERTNQYEAAVLPHLDAAYNLARWLLRDDKLAEDAVQDASLNALRHFDALQGDSARPWLLGIVRNACHDILRQRQRGGEQLEFDEITDSPLPDGSADPDPAARWEQGARARQVNAAIAALAPSLREVIVLRELEEMRYDEIAQVAGIPVGTVMSRLSRARALLRAALWAEAPGAMQMRKRDEQA